MTRWRQGLALLLAACLAPPARSETRALLLGVSHYGFAGVHDLDGPQNDLAAMGRLVRDIGAADVVVLQDAQVTRSATEAAIQAIGMRARPGDWILLYYSGHGAQARAAIATARDGAFDQFLPLAGFDPEHQDPERFIVDKDFYAWLKRYIPASVHVLMMVDSCHSGSMQRSVDPAAFAFTPRVAFRGEERAFQLVARPGPRLPAVTAVTGDGGATRDDLPNLVYLGASRDDQLAFELPLPQQGSPGRGALTYAFEQALRPSAAAAGAAPADLDRDGRVTVLEISVYLDSQVRLLTAQRQESMAAFPAGWSDLPILSALPPARPPPAVPPVAVAVRPAPALPGGIGPAAGWRLAASADEADFVWDMGTGKVLRRSGDLVASGVTNVAGMSGVVGKWRAVEALRPLMSEMETRLAIAPRGSGAVYRDRAAVSIEIARTEHGRRAGPLYATVFDLASDGTVQLLYPLAPDGDGAIAAQGGTLVLRTTVVPPYGTDHLIALTTPAVPAALRAVLRAMDGQRASDRLPEIVAGHLQGGRAGSLSIAELYTDR